MIPMSDWAMQRCLTEVRWGIDGVTGRRQGYFDLKLAHQLAVWLWRWTETSPGWNRTEQVLQPLRLLFSYFFWILNVGHLQFGLNIQKRHWEIEVNLLTLDLFRLDQAQFFQVDPSLGERSTVKSPMITGRSCGIVG